MTKKYYMQPDFEEQYFEATEVLSASSNGEVKDDWEIPGDIF